MAAILSRYSATSGDVGIICHIQVGGRGRKCGGQPSELCLYMSLETDLQNRRVPFGFPGGRTVTTSRRTAMLAAVRLVN